VLLIHEDAAVGGYGWATTRNSSTTDVFDIDGAHLRSEHPLLEAWIQAGAAADLFRRAGQDFAALKLAARTPGFRPVPLKGVTLSTDHRVATSVVTSHNVVAYLPGASRPDEFVIYTAHWDAHGVGEWPDASGDRIFHGARDNASGTAMLLELGRYFASRPRPARSMLFIAVTAEEKGMLGSKYYATAPLFPLERTVAAINMDGVLGAGRARSVSTLGDSQNTLQDQLERLARQSGRYLEPDSSPQAGYFTRSDQFWFAKQGVPSLGFSPGSDLLAGGLPAGLTAKRDYATKQYHQPGDNYDASMDFGNMPEDALLLAKLGDVVAETPAWPDWHEHSEFKPVRDRIQDRKF
jgi:Zn-dependent M28 family amino/carboxypeptidase